MVSKLFCTNQILITISVVFGSIALTFSCIGTATSNWQTVSKNTTSGQLYISHTANFFYACHLNSVQQVLSCGERSTNISILQYYRFYIKANQSVLNFHLNTAAGFSIIGIIFIFLEIITTLLMSFGKQGERIYLIVPIFLFIACLFMLPGLAEGSRVLYYNGYSANLYETAHVLAIFSFLISTIVAGQLFQAPLRSVQSRKIKTRK